MPFTSLFRRWLGGFPPYTIFAAFIPRPQLPRWLITKGIAQAVAVDKWRMTEYTEGAPPSCESINGTGTELRRGVPQDRQPGRRFAGEPWIAGNSCGVAAAKPAKRDVRQIEQTCAQSVTA